MFLDPLSKVPVIDLMRGVIIQSGNDASIALAEHISGSEIAFSDIMNQQAEILGMTNSEFKNSSGLPENGMYSTARDLSKIANAIIRDHPTSYKIYTEKQSTNKQTRKDFSIGKEKVFYRWSTMLGTFVCQWTEWRGSK